jgi:hypothetical protein
MIRRCRDITWTAKDLAVDVTLGYEMSRAGRQRARDVGEQPRELV